MIPLKEPTKEEIERYQLYKMKPVSVQPVVSDPPGTVSYNFTYPRPEQEAKDLDGIKTNHDLIFIKDDVFNNEQIELLDYQEWNPQQHGSFHFPLHSNFDVWLNSVGPLASDHPDLPLLEFLIKDAVNGIRELDPTVEFTYFHGTYYTTQNHVHIGDHIHRDFHRIIGGWTSLYHLTGSTGPTSMFHDFVPDPNKKPSQVIDFKQGRRIIFPGLYAHRAEVSEPGDTRVIAVVRFQIKSKLNDHMFDLTPEIKARYDLNKINHDNQPRYK